MEIDEKTKKEKEIWNNLDGIKLLFISRKLGFLEPKFGWRGEFIFVAVELISFAAKIEYGWQKIWT